MSSPDPSSTTVPLVVTVLGPDRPGLVESIAGVVARHEANWVESRLIHLGGSFAGVIRLQVPSQAEENLKNDLTTLDLVASVQSGATTSPTSAERLRMELIGPDRPGIVAEIAEALSRHAINVEEMETECVSAPWTGEPLFQATVDLLLPKSETADALRADLDRICEALTLEIDLIQSHSPAAANE